MTLATGAATGRHGRPGRVWTNLKYGLRLAWSASPRAFIRFFVLGVLNAAMPAAAVYLGATLVNRIAEAHAASQQLYYVLPIVVGLWISASAQRTLSAYLGFGKTLFVRRVELEAEQRLLQQAARIDVSYFDDSDWHDRLARAKRDVAWRPGDLTWSVMGLSGQVVNIVLMTSLLASLHYMLIILAVAATAVSLFIERRVVTGLYELSLRETPEEREREYVSNLLVQPRSVREIRAHVIEHYLLERHWKLSANLFRIREQAYSSAARSTIITGLIGGTTLAIAYLFVAARGIAGAINPGGVVLVIGAFTSVSSTLSQMSNTFVTVDEHSTFLDDYFSFLAITSRMSVPACPKRLPEYLISIDFNDVTFTYPGALTPALANLTLHIGPGELVALVGDNGAGKSTLIKLLLRFYDVDRGAILVGGVDVRDVDPSELRARLGVLFQDFTGYELSVRDNVVLGRPSGVVDDRKVLTALRAARSDRLVTRMNGGLDSKVGRLFAGAHDLSGGEWQRLALARIMYRDADIWFLDEPTASLDAEAEVAIFRELKGHLNGRIGIVTSHRFSTVRTADRIIVLMNGRVLELGTHDQLVTARGRYSELFELQAAGYR